MNEVITYYLEMKSPSSLRGKGEANGMQIYECEIKQFQFNRFLYQFVGEEWGWTDKICWSDEQWKVYAENDNLRTWVAYHEGSPAGYYELQKQNSGDVEIAYFGLAARFISMGFGSYLLTHAITSAWAWEGATRVWVHTCTLDHPSALQNYRARGLQIYKVEADSLVHRRAPTTTAEGHLV